MKIGIIGSGNMGRTLGLLWQDKGHEVFFGSAKSQNIEYIGSLTSRPILSGSLADAATFGDVLIYCLRDVLPSEIAPVKTWENKIIVDMNNGIIPNEFQYEPVIKSYAERIHENVSGAKVIKAFNTLAQEIYYLPAEAIREHQVAGFFAGNDTKAKKIVAVLIGEAGLIPVDCGELEQSAKQLESLGDLVRLLMIDKNYGPTMGLIVKQLPAVETPVFGVRQPTRYK